MLADNSPQRTRSRAEMLLEYRREKAKNSLANRTKTNNSTCAVTPSKNTTSVLRTPSASVSNILNNSRYTKTKQTTTVKRAQKTSPWPLLSERQKISATTPSRSAKTPSKIPNVSDSLLSENYIRQQHQGNSTLVRNTPTSAAFQNLQTHLVIPSVDEEMNLQANQTQSIVSLKIELETRINECNSLRELGLSLQSTILSLREEIKAQWVLEEKLRAQITDLKENNSQKIKGCEQKIDILSQALSDKDSLIEALEDVVKSLRMELQSALESKNSSQSNPEIWIQEVRIEELENEGAQQKAEIHELKRHNSQLLAMLDSKSQVECDNLKQIADLEKENSVLLSSFANLKDQVKSATQKNTQLESKLTDYNDAIDLLAWLDTQVSLREAQISDMEAKLLAANSELFELEGLSSQLRIDNAKITRALEEAYNENQELFEKHYSYTTIFNNFSTSLCAALQLENVQMNENTLDSNNDLILSKIERIVRERQEALEKLKFSLDEFALLSSKVSDMETKPPVHMVSVAVDYASTESSNQACQTLEHSFESDDIKNANETILSNFKALKFYSVTLEQMLDERKSTISELRAKICEEQDLRIQIKNEADAITSRLIAGLTKASEKIKSLEAKNNNNE